ncbi:MAG TPA: NADH-quinone oxidoreductase subunit NuoH [Candidatus Binatia bacterium]|jgi:NADH-quinone oxidoreductase subunit H|nr:NADH-quinone oxidoreductase subunit NuoH [Candidatus Binatia bacterium]
MQQLVDSLFSGPPPVPLWLCYLAAMLLFGGIVVFGFVLPMAGTTTWVERRIAGRIQSRLGPNRTGPAGFLQWLADGIKSVLKEDIVPTHADARLFKLAPYVVMSGFVLAFVAIPFGGPLIIADLNVGILYVTAVTSLVVVGILMAGWSSNNKWSLLGGIRSAAQIVSYEIPAGLSIFPIVMLTGALSMQSIIAGQGWQPWSWNLFYSPFTFVAFFVFFVSALAEGNRTPFDLPEAESELVMGAFTEYSGIRNLLFFMAEWGNLYVIGAIVTTLFLGGGHIPGEARLADAPLLRVPLQFVAFFLKSYLWVIVAIWLRWTLPRIRVDQMMVMCWKYLVPIAFVNLIGTALWMVFFPPALEPVVRALLTAATVLLLVGFVRRIRFHLRHARLRRMDLSFNPLSTASVPR